MSETDRERLILDHLDYASAICRSMARRLPPKVDREDLASAARLGLVDAARRYNPSEGTTFRTFSARRIRGAILDYLRNIDHLTRSQRREQRNGERAYPHVRSLNALAALWRSEIVYDTECEPSERREQRRNRHAEDLADQVLGLLEDDYRELLTEYYLRGRRMREIGALRGLTESSISQHVSMALDLLRSRLAARGVMS